MEKLFKTLQPKFDRRAFYSVVKPVTHWTFNAPNQIIAAAKHQDLHSVEIYEHNGQYWQQRSALTRELLSPVCMSEDLNKMLVYHWCDRNNKAVIDIKTRKEAIDGSHTHWVLENQLDLGDGLEELACTMPGHFKTLSDGSFLYAGVNPVDKMVVVGKIQSEGPGEIQTELRSYRIPRGEVQDVAITRKGHILLIADSDYPGMEHFSVIDHNTGYKTVLNLKHPVQNRLFAGINDEGNTLAVLETDDKRYATRLRVYRLTFGNDWIEDLCFTIGDYKTSNATQIAVSEDGQCFAVSFPDDAHNCCIVYDKKGMLLNSPHWDSGFGSACQFKHDKLYIGDRKGRMFEYAVQS